MSALNEFSYRHGNKPYWAIAAACGNLSAQSDGAVFKDDNLILHFGKNCRLGKLSGTINSCLLRNRSGSFEDDGAAARSKASAQGYPVGQQRVRGNGVDLISRRAHARR